MSGLAAVIFDMDGTLIDSSTVVPDAYIASIQRLGGPAYDREQIVASYRLGPPRTILSHLLGRQCGDTELGEYHAQLASEAHRLRIFPGVPEVLNALVGVLPRAVFSGASLRACSILLESVDLRRHFDVVVGGDEVALPKPAPHGILLTCERLGVKPEAVAYVGDAPVDVEAARRSGAVAVAAAWGHQYSPQAPADCALEEPGDLLALLAVDP